MIILVGEHDGEVHFSVRSFHFSELYHEKSTSGEIFTSGKVHRRLDTSISSKNYE
jgi:hypothetical protein